jgi:hypothetical protein
MIDRYLMDAEVTRMSARITEATLVHKKLKTRESLEWKYAANLAYNAAVDNYFGQAWANGGGWNSAGSESDQMRAWAKSTFPKPTK